MTPKLTWLESEVLDYIRKHEREGLNRSSIAKGLIRELRSRGPVPARPLIEVSEALDSLYRMGIIERTYDGTYEIPEHRGGCYGSADEPGRMPQLREAQSL